MQVLRGQGTGRRGKAREETGELPSEVPLGNEMGDMRRGLVNSKKMWWCETLWDVALQGLCRACIALLWRELTKTTSSCVVYPRSLDETLRMCLIADFYLQRSPRLIYPLDTIIIIRLPIIRCVAEAPSSQQIIDVDKIYPLGRKLSPNPIPRTDRPSRLIPVSHLNPLCMCHCHLWF